MRHEHTSRRLYTNRSANAYVCTMQAIPRVEDIETGALGDDVQVTDDRAITPRAAEYHQCGVTKAYCTMALALTAGFAVLSIWRHWDDETSTLSIWTHQGHHVSERYIACSNVCDHACCDCYCFEATNDTTNALLNGTLLYTTFRL